MIPTATELVFKRLPNHDGIFVLRNIEEFMIEFAKLHVEAALEKASDKFDHYSNKNVILTAYPLTNIK